MMRVGDLLSDLSNVSAGAAAFPKGSQQRAELLKAAESRSDDDAELMLEIADATSYGNKQKMLRVGGGLVGGALVGALVTALVMRSAR
ncbi:MAG: hypothetical protein JWL95_3247 [Gemmatimonadetes bacterium]|nr:hypothetical protein [Gemmatimonadota bacterium]